MSDPAIAPSVRPWLLLGLLLLAIMPPAASDRSGHNFEGTFHGTGAIAVPTSVELGSLTPGILLTHLAPGTLEAGPRISTGPARLVYEESRFQTSTTGGRHVVVPHREWVQRTRTVLDVREATLAVERADNQNRLWALVEAQKGAAFLADGSPCTFAPLRMAPTELEAWTRFLLGTRKQAEDPLATLEDDWRIRVACRAPELAVRNLSAVQFAGFDVRAQLVLGDGRGVETRFATRWRVTPNETLPTVYDHELITLRVSSTAAESTLVPNVNLQRFADEVELWTPALVIQGRLQIPASQGNVRWDSEYSEGSLAPLQPRGLFHASARDEQTIRLVGLVQNPAPATVDATQQSSAALWTATLGLALALLVAALRWTSSVPLATLFSRLTRNDALEHTRRRALVDAIAANPGARTQDLCGLLGYSRRVAEHHLEVLRRHGLVVRRRVGRATAFFLHPPRDPRVAERLLRLRSPSAQRLLRALDASPNGSQRALAAAAGLSQPYVSQLLRKLMEAGLVLRSGSGNQARYRSSSGLDPDA